MSTPANITVPAEANPAVLNVGPWLTFIVNDCNGAEIAHMDAPSPGTQPHVIATDPSAYPLTIIFTDNTPPEDVVVDNNAIPPGAVALN